MWSFTWENMLIALLPKRICWLPCYLREYADCFVTWENMLIAWLPERICWLLGYLREYADCCVTWENMLIAWLPERICWLPCYLREYADCCVTWENMLIALSMWSFPSWMAWSAVISASSPPHALQLSRLKASFIRLIASFNWQNTFMDISRRDRNPEPGNNVRITSHTHYTCRHRVRTKSVQINIVNEFEHTCNIITTRTY